MELQNKIERLKLLIPRSASMKSVHHRSAEEWDPILKKLPVEKIDELLLILQEEAEMLAEMNLEKKRKLQKLSSK